MQPLRVVEAKILGQPTASLFNSLVIMEVDLLVFHGSPQPLDKNVVKDPAPT
jgi:hypothetical protein